MEKEVTKGFIESFSKTIIKEVSDQTVELIKLENTISNKVSEIVNNHVSEEQEALDLLTPLHALLESDEEITTRFTNEVLCNHDDAVHFLLEQYRNKEDPIIEETILKSIIEEIVSYLSLLLSQSEKYENQQPINEEEKRLLYYFAIMPSIEISTEIIEWIDCEENDMDRLCKTGWLKDNGNSYYMHPIIKETLLLEKSSFPTDLGIEFVTHLANNDFIEDPDSEIFPKFEIASSILDNQQLRDDPLLIEAYFNLAVLNEKQWKFKEAKECFKKALVMNEKIFGTDHPDTAQFYYILGSQCSSQTEFEEADEYLKKALAINEKVFGPDHPFTATIYNRLGILYQDKIKFEEAEEYFKKALAINEKVFGTNHLETSIIYCNLGTLHLTQRNYEKSEEYLKKTLDINIKIFGTDHPKTADIYSLLALVYKLSEKYEDSEINYKKAIAINEKELGLDHTDTMAAYSNLAGLYRHQAYMYKIQGNHEMLQKYARMARDIDKIIGR